MTSLEVGEALIEIRDSRLYRVEAKTFGEYIQKKFKMSHQHANRLMTGAPIAREIEPMGVIPERAVREIAKVEPSKRQEVFEKATSTASGHVPTAREIEQFMEMGTCCCLLLFQSDPPKPMKEVIQAAPLSSQQGRNRPILAFPVYHPPIKCSSGFRPQKGCCCFVAVFSAFWRVFVRVVAILAPSLLRAFSPLEPVFIGFYRVF